MERNYRLVATQVGDLVKWVTSVNSIDRSGQSILQVRNEKYPNESITSARAQAVYNWVLSLAATRMELGERDNRLFKTCRAIVSRPQTDFLEDILADAGVGVGVDPTRKAAFDSRRFHPQVNVHAKKLFLQGNFFHAVFECAKAYNKVVQEKAASPKDGEKLMLDVWGCEKGVLKITSCASETDRNVQDGIKFLSAGLMRAVRNPTAHEPAVDWPISEHDCLDILSFVSFLFRKLDDRVFYGASKFPINRRHQQVATSRKECILIEPGKLQFPINRRHQQVATLKECGPAGKCPQGGFQSIGVTNK